jgi:hypothetical protein
MRKAKHYAHVTKLTLRSEIEECLECQTRLRRCTISRRTIITLTGVIRLTYCGYRCPNTACGGRKREYLSAAAMALALPGFTFGLDIVMLVGHLRLAEHQTVDEVHQGLQRRLAPLSVTISRREILYLFEAYAALLRAGSAVTEDVQWLAQVEENEGLILSIDGIQPDKGNETIYVVRDVLTDRVLVAEKVGLSSTETMKQLLAPVKALGLPVLGIISDAQDSEVLAIAQLWPEAPHQLCQFHVLREAGRPAYEADREVKTAMRKVIGRKVRDFRGRVAKVAKPAGKAEAEQLAVLDDYAGAVQAALNRDGKQPFDYAGIAASEALSEVQSSLNELEKRGQLPAKHADSG